MYRICFVCSGNICRSPMAEAVMRSVVAESELRSEVTVDSAGTGPWHAGDGADRRALAALRSSGYDGSTHVARQFDRSWFADRDLVVALDGGHLRELQALAPTPEDRDKVVLLRSFGPGGDTTGADLDVADPYHSDAAGFADVLGQVEESCRGLLEHLVSRRADRA